MYPNLLLSPPGPQLRLQALQVPQTPHWHSELEAAGGEEPPGDIIVSDDNAIQAVILNSLEDITTHNHHHRHLYHHHHCSPEDRSHDHVGKRVAICRDSCAQSSSAKKDPLPVFMQSSVYICIYPFLCVLFNPLLSSWHEQ